MVTLHHFVPIKAAPEKVFAAIATQNGNRGWWTSDSVVENKAGGKAEFGFDKRQMVFRVTIEKLEQVRRSS
jgi:uncharacterized protein YndB with AHSA1/START domain